MNEATRQNKTVIKMVIDLTDQTKARNIFQKEAEDRRRELQELEVKIAEKNAQKNKTIMSLAMFLVQLQGQEAERDMGDNVFIEDDEQNQRRRIILSELVRMLNVIYDLDPTAEEVPQEIWQIITQNTQDW